MSTFVYSVEFERDRDGRWTATISELPGCSTWGDSKDAALEALKEAAFAYLTTAAEAGNLVEPTPGVKLFDKAPVLAIDIQLPRLTAHNVTRWVTME